MKKFFLSMLSEGSEVSVKRVITFTLTVCFIVLLAVDCFVQMDINERMYDILEWSIIGGMGSTVIEKFATKRTGGTPTTPTP